MEHDKKCGVALIHYHHDRRRIWWRPHSRCLPQDVLFFLFFVLLWFIWFGNQTLKSFVLFPRFFDCQSKILANVPDRFDGFYNSVDHHDGDELVPNLIHFVRLGKEEEEVLPEEAACISAALRTQPGSTVLVHTDRAELKGVAWRRLTWQAGRRLRVQRRPRPSHVFGMPFRDEASRHRVVALRVLMKYGGMFLANTVYLRSDLTAYRHYEAATASVASDADVILAHRDARLLARWLHHFHDADLVWERRPATPPQLRRTVTETAFIDVRGLRDPTASKSVSSEDWYLWADGPEA